MIFLTAEDIAEFNAEIVPHGRQEGSKVEAVANRSMLTTTRTSQTFTAWPRSISSPSATVTFFLMATNVRPSKAWRYFSVLMALHCGKTQNWSKLRLKQLKAASTLNKPLNTYAG